MSLRQLEIRAIQAFLTLAETRHFGRAAGLLGLSQPAFSRQIQRLEHAAGGPLFERSSTGAELLPRGRLIEECMQRALDAVEEAEGLLAQRRRVATGEVVLGTVVSAGAFFLPRVLQTLREAHDSIQVTVFEAESAALEQALSRGRVELALHVEPFRNEELVSLRLWTEPYHLVGPAGRFEPGTSVALETLCAERWAVPPSPRVEALLRRSCPEAHLVSVTDNLETIRRLIEEQGTLSLLPAVVTRNFDWKASVTELSGDPFTRSVYLSHRGVSHLGAAGGRVREALIAADFEAQVAATSVA